MLEFVQRTCSLYSFCKDFYMVPERSGVTMNRLPFEQLHMEHGVIQELTEHG